MSESALIVDVLKKLLKARGLTYRDLGRRLQLSEASVKRVFAHRTFTLQRLEQVCQAIDISVGELARMASDAGERSAQSLTLAQEQALDVGIVRAVERIEVVVQNVGAGVRCEHEHDGNERLGQAQRGTAPQGVSRTQELSEEPRDKTFPVRSDGEDMILVQALGNLPVPNAATA